MTKKKFIAAYFEKKCSPISILDEAVRDLSNNVSSSTGRKTLIICIDGISLDKIQGMIRNNKLISFKGLIENGVSGYLRSTIPPDSLPAWPSFITGKNPAKHGITGYFKKIGPENVVVNSTMLNTCKYWDIFNSSGLNSVVMNLPITYPPENIRGIMISDYLTPQGRDFAYPPGISEKLKEVGYFTELPITRFFDYDLTRPEPYIYKINKTKEVAISIMKNYPWDTFTLAFISPDKAHHMLGLEGEAIDAVYEKIDHVLGEILGVIDRSNTDIFLVSDHGSSNYEKEFALHPWLCQKGLLVLNSLNEQVSRKTDKNPAGLALRLLSFVYRLKVSLNLPSMPFFHFPKAVLEDNKIDPCPFDWSKTKVYSLSPPTSNYLPVFINTKGERPFGIINKPKEYQVLRENLISEFTSIEDPETCEKVVEKVYLREELFSGPYLNDMPDLVVQLKNEYIGFSGYIDRIRISRGPVFRKFDKPVIDHSINGLFIFSGPGSRKNVEVKEISLIDIFPAILYSRRLPIPDDIDGRVKNEIFIEGFFKEAEIKFQKSDAKDAPGKEGWLKKHSPKDLELINQELKRLGYIK
ncbi:MAG: alkaline phosphatase family protein [Candidatus Omnitrophota bacterium]